MKEGCIVEQGTFGMLKANPESAFSDMLKSVGGNHEKEEESETQVSGPNKEEQPVNMSNPAKTTNAPVDDTQINKKTKQQKKQPKK